jgi:hypothetical protein
MGNNDKKAGIRKRASSTETPGDPPPAKKGREITVQWLKHQHWIAHIFAILSNDPAMVYALFGGSSTVIGPDGNRIMMKTKGDSKAAVTRRLAHAVWDHKDESADRRQLFCDNVTHFANSLGNQLGAYVFSVLV